jgi:hypothetical protein
MDRYYLRQKEDGNSLAVFSTVKRVGDEEYMSVNETKAEIDEYKKKYEELLYAVMSKFPNESRHETALRYIKQAETHDGTPEQADKGE